MDRLRRGFLALTMVLAILQARDLHPARAQPPSRAVSPNVLTPTNLEPLRQVSIEWASRPGPDREVVDQVCLVPDVPTFLEAISAWDRHHFFPILIDDVELTFKFLRAFHPARIVRYPKRGAPIPPASLWERSVESVGRSWDDENAKERPLPGDAVPKALGRTPPGLVFSCPESPMLPGAVALAAGRFQPLIQSEIPQKFADVLSLEQAGEVMRKLERQVSGQIPKYSALGDDCDFLTLAGDWPYRYADPKGTNAFDDLLGRVDGGPERWAYAGRLLGDARTSVYRAMCSLFLQPRSALLFNTYSDKEHPWSDYSTAPAAPPLARFLSVTQRSGINGNLASWQRVFDPLNPFTLLLINTSGNPSDFNIEGGPGFSYDVPPSMPAALSVIHSWSCANPDDPETLAGRWLANGAFIYYGSVSEPLLQAFRPPSHVALLLSQGVPFPAALRRLPGEPFSEPWKLLYLGDPLYRLEPRRVDRPRLAEWKVIAKWPAYEEFRQPDPNATPDERLVWAIKMAVFAFQGEATLQQPIDLPSYALAIPRQSLRASLRPFHDALLIDLLTVADRSRDLSDRLGRIPPAERGPLVVRTLERAEFSDLHRLMDTNDARRAIPRWERVIRGSWPGEFLRQYTRQVGLIVERINQLESWRPKLQAALRDVGDNTAAKPALDEEIRRVDDILARRRK